MVTSVNYEATENLRRSLQDAAPGARPASSITTTYIPRQVSDKWRRLLWAILVGLIVALGASYAYGADEVEADNGVRPTMLASYYSWDYASQPTASGQLFDPRKYTAASPNIPLGTRLLVSRGGKSVVVVVNDRMPPNGRDLDLSLASAEAIELAPVVGLDWVTVTRVDAAPEEDCELGAKAINALPDHQRFPYGQRCGAPPAPRGMIWADDYSLIRNPLQPQNWGA
jgi:Lytic transglycolase